MSSYRSSVMAGCILIILIVGTVHMTWAQQSGKPGVKPTTLSPPSPQRPWPFSEGKEAQDELAPDLLAKNIVLIFDGSGSMNETDCARPNTKIAVAKQAASEWAKSVPQKANLGLISFNADGWTRVPPASRNLSGFLNRVQQIRAGGNTPLAESFSQAYSMLTAQARKQLGYGEYLIVVITDGIADSPSALETQVNRILANTPIMIHTIGFCIGDRHSLNQKGRTVYRNATNPAELRKGLQEVLAEAESFDVTGFKR
jgi:Ca-activated chloride channel homolog